MRTAARFGLCAVVFAHLVALPSAVQAKSFLWRISAKNNKAVAPSYLLGSIHMGKKSFYPLPEPVRKAFAACKVLVLEARPDKAMSALGPLMRQGLYAPPDTLEKHISAKTWRRVLKKAATAGLPQMAVERMKPWMLALTFSALDLKAAGYDPSLGIEMHLLGKVAKRRIAVLEGAAKQIKMLASFPKKQQEAFLLYSLSQSHLLKTMMARIVSLWKSGNVRGLGRLLRKSLAKERRFRPVFKKLITDRNRSMTKTMHAMLKKSAEPHFFVIGAGHLAGKLSIVRLLAKKGYRLEQL